MGIGFALLLIAFALLDFAVGSGLLALKRWAMNLAIALSAVHLLLGVGSLFGHPLGVFSVLSALVYGATVVYLLLPPVRALFR